MPSYSMGELIHQIGNRPYAFVCLPFAKRQANIEREIRAAVDAASGSALVAVTARDVKGSGHDLLAKIHGLIERSDVVIADITGANPNVLYEVGYAARAGKPLLLLSTNVEDVPANLRGREFIPIDPLDLQALRADVIEQLIIILRNPQLALLRDMLQADATHPTYILVSPRVNPAIIGLVFDKRTFGDNLGVLGLLAGFGSIFRKTLNVELVNAPHASPDLDTKDANLYLIGSPAVNPFVARFLDRIQRQREPSWHFLQDTDDVWWLASRRNGIVERKHGHKTRLADDVEAWTHDFGLLLRGPHPTYSDRNVMVMAGAHSLGTGAACLSATRTELIVKIGAKAEENGIDIADPRTTFWVVVEAQTSPANDFNLGPEDVHIVEMGRY